VTRQLYSDDELAIFDAMRPILITGIEGAATRGDLVDRAIVVEQPAIPDSQRLSEREFWRQFELARPRILGALLDAAALALRDRDSIRLPGRPRMADFAVTAAAAAPAIGWTAEEFLEAYTLNREASSGFSL
jgi:hypothetical protein